MYIKILNEYFWNSGYQNLLVLNGSSDFDLFVPYNNYWNYEKSCLFACYTPATKLGGILESPCPSVRPSVRLSGRIWVSGA